MSAYTILGAIRCHTRKKLGIICNAADKPNMVYLNLNHR